MDTYMSSLVSSIGSEFYNARNSKELLLKSYLANDNDLLDKFNLYFVSLKQAVDLTDQSVVTIKKMMFYTICQFLAILSIQGLNETDINNALFLDYYNLDHCTNKDELLDCFNGLCIKLMNVKSLVAKKREVSKQIEKCIRYINEHLYEKLTLSSLAAYLNYNPDYLSQKFKNEVGQTISIYITSKKIEEAKILLKRYKSISYVSDILCFSNESHFINVFKKHTGITAKQYQNWVGLDDNKENIK